MSTEEFIDKCIETNQYFGLGNPESKILFVGKEAGIKVGRGTPHGTGLSWKKDSSVYSKRYVPKDENLKNGNHTWQKYQKLFELIAKKANFPIVSKIDKCEITFVEYLFTTELSNLNAEDSVTAKKQVNFKPELKKRKEFFWESDFINKFDIVVIFALDNNYIETYEGEVCKLFKVNFKEKINIGRTQNIWIHSSDEKEGRNVPKLVIHTRQLTNGCSNELLEKVADLISEHIAENEIKIKPATIEG